MKLSILAKFGTQTYLTIAVFFYFGCTKKFRFLLGQIGPENLRTAVSQSIFGIRTRSLVGSTRLVTVKNILRRFGLEISCRDNLGRRKWHLFRYSRYISRYISRAKYSV
jgi:hypothetical protein